MHIRWPTYPKHNKVEKSIKASVVLNKQLAAKCHHSNSLLIFASLCPAYLLLICSADHGCQVSTNLGASCSGSTQFPGCPPVKGTASACSVPAWALARGTACCRRAESWLTYRIPVTRTGNSWKLFWFCFTLITANTLGQATQDAVNQITDASQTGRSNGVQIKTEQLNTSQKRPVLILLCPTGVLSLKVLGFSDNFI